MIEHLEKSDGFKLIQIMESIAKKKVIIFTPNGFLRQEGVFDSNPWQEHVSGWEINEMEKLGFTVKGHGGHKTLRGMRSKSSIILKCFGLAYHIYRRNLVLKNPKSSYQLLCYKEIN